MYYCPFSTDCQIIDYHYTPIFSVGYDISLSFSVLSFLSQERQIIEIEHRRATEFTSLGSQQAQWEAAQETHRTGQERPEGFQQAGSCQPAEQVRAVAHAVLATSASAESWWAEGQRLSPEGWFQPLETFLLSQPLREIFIFFWESCHLGHCLDTFSAFLFIVEIISLFHYI